MEELTDAPLSRYTTLKIGGQANRFCQPKSSDELVSLIDSLTRASEPWYIIGGGSNLLISSHGVEGTVIRTAQMTGMKNPERGVIDADAGVRLPHLAKYAASMGLAGLEFAVGIPGTVGGGVIMNAGAHSSSMSNIIENVTVYDSKLANLVTLKNSEMGFQYRKCNLDPARHIVLSARLRMKEDIPEQIQERTTANEEYRWRTQPLGWPNAGSTFKNPFPDKGAGMLLDQSGAKSLREGNAAVSAIHANFVINMGGATSEEVTTLLRKMQDCVYSKFEVRLHPEWKVIGKFSDSEKEIWRNST
jgi:UDP-N-acetylmuramate dehydrogenase